MSEAHPCNLLVGDVVNVVRCNDGPASFGSPVHGRYSVLRVTQGRVEMAPADGGGNPQWYTINAREKALTCGRGMFWVEVVT